MDRVTAGVKGCAAYLDDVIVTGSTLEEHNHNVLELFKRIESFGFRVRLEKCSFARKEIAFLNSMFLASLKGRILDFSLDLMLIYDKLMFYQFDLFISNYNYNI